MHEIIFIDHGDFRSGIIGFDDVGFRIIAVITQGGDRSIIGIENDNFSLLNNHHTV